MIGAVDIGGTKIAVGILNQKGDLLANGEFPTAAERGPEDRMAAVAGLFAELANRTGRKLVNMTGIGIGSTGPVDPLTGEVGEVEFLPGWRGFSITDALYQVYNLPIALENDADAAALGEARWGAGRGAKRLIYVTISTGIGGGMVFDGKLYRGVDGAHPEIGHHIIDPSGPACACGAHGCWESIASGPSMSRWYDPARMVSAREICALAEQGELRALEAVRREGRYLGLGLVNLINLFTPDVIVLGGGVMNSRHLFWEQMKEEIRTACGYVPAEKTLLAPAALGRSTGLYGAACAWLHRYKN